MNDLTNKLKNLENIAGTYCVGKVEGTIKTPVEGLGDYYAYAKGISYLGDSIDDAVSLAIKKLNTTAA